jgi:hypothetical protein
MMLPNITLIVMGDRSSSLRSGCKIPTDDLLLYQGPYPYNLLPQQTCIMWFFASEVVDFIEKAHGDTQAAPQDADTSEPTQTATPALGTA